VRLVRSLLGTAAVIAIASLLLGTASAAVPAAPTGIAVRGIEAHNATVNWTQSPGGGIVNNTVHLYAGTLLCSGTATNLSTGGAATSFNVTGLLAGVTYSATVTSWNATGQSAASSCIGWTTTFSGGGLVGGTTTGLVTIVLVGVLLAAVFGMLVAGGRTLRGK
jgi:hypothetical protein